MSFMICERLPLHEIWILLNLIRCDTYWREALLLFILGNICKYLVLIKVNIAYTHVLVQKIVSESFVENVWFLKIVRKRFGTLKSFTF